MKKRALFVLFALALSVASISNVAANGDAEGVSYGVAGPPVLEYFEGRITVNGVEAELGQKVAPGSVVQAGEDSMCEIAVGHNVLRLYSNTIAVMNVDAYHSELDLKTGAVGAVLDKVKTISSGGSFAVNTPTVVAGVRGTVFFIKVEDSDNTYVCTCNGTLHLTGEGVNTQNSASRHAAVRFTASDGGAVQQSTATLLYHNDTEMEDIASAIDSTIDWSTQ